MAAQTTNVSGLNAIRIILNTATTQLFFSGAVDGQELQVILQQDGTGGRLITSGNIPNIPAPNPAANADTIYTLVYDALLNEWSVQGVGGEVTLDQPEIVGVFSNAAVPFGSFTTAGVVISTLAPATAPAGTYRLSVYGDVTTTIAGGSVSAAGVTLGWTDDEGAQTLANALSSLTAGTAKLQNTYTFRSNGTAAITITGTATTGNPTSGVVALSAILERIA
jgi:hypothetical protein